MNNRAQYTALRCSIQASRADNNADRYRAVAQEFAQLVEIRNQIIHGKPCTGPNGDARLSSGRVLEIVDLENAADAFSECSSKVNELLYGFLKAYVPN